MPLPPDAWQSVDAISKKTPLGGNSGTLVHIEGPPPYAAAPGKLLSLVGGALQPHHARRIVIPQQEEISDET